MLVLFVLLRGCQSIYIIGKPMQRSELFFGLSIPGGKEVSEAQWQAFVDDTITPRFPEGFTVIDGAGQWRESSGNIAHERSKILVIIHDSDARTYLKMDQIRDEYKRRFHQEAVIRETEDAQVAF